MKYIFLTMALLAGACYIDFVIAEPNDVVHHRYEILCKTLDKVIYDDVLNITIDDWRGRDEYYYKPRIVDNKIVYLTSDKVFIIPEGSSCEILRQKGEK